MESRKGKQINDRGNKVKINKNLEINIPFQILQKEKNPHPLKHK